MPFEFIPYSHNPLDPEEQVRRAGDFFQLCSKRRTIRDFSPDPLPDGLLETLVKTAGTAPSGANKQPWTFVIVTDPEIKNQIRIAS